MIALTPQASAHLDEFERYYIEQRLQAPRPYPELASLELLWLKRGRYWIAYDPVGPVIAGIFFDTDDIPNRAR